ncbi:MAG: mechanosensitive ion channel [Burkholderiaceae bacterium]|nr:mechanosensitive ion channel [Roseateles sp.]MBV8469973.1 mechanosensitive ion channel [Burkholderiaceae bacterium]
MNHTLTLDELQALLASLSKPSALMELGLLAACLGLSLLAVNRLQRWVKPRRVSVLFGQRAYEGVLFPLMALLLAMGARHMMVSLGMQTAVFRLVFPVLFALFVIRLGARVLRLAMPNSTLVKALERSMSWLAWGASILWITGILPVLIDELDDIQLKIGGAHVTVRALLEGGMNACIVMVLVLWLASIIEDRLMNNAEGDLSLRMIAANLSRSILIGVGLLVALNAAGIDLTTLSVLGGALGVGIGFGLQRLAANYVSGFVILAERSLRIGDMIKVDGFEGRITDIKTRFTVIRALNGREAIVPNETMIGQRVENSSLADPKVAVSTVVVVAGDADLGQVMLALREATAGVDRVLADPAPNVALSNFAPDGLELTISFWINDPHNGQGGVKSDVNLAILKTLREMKVEIPSPQRVVHMA